MFERYNEKARRAIFFARYEASIFGSPYIETEHLLLGLVREDRQTLERALGGAAGVDQIRQRVEAQMGVLPKISTSVDMPLSHECMRVLAYAAEEAERLGHKHIGTEHLVLGLLREPGCGAAKILEALGARLDAVREQISGHGPGAEIELNSINFILHGRPEADLHGRPLAERVDEALVGFVVSKLSAEARRMFAYAAVEAGLLGHTEIGAGHLLLGVLREESSAAAKLLEVNGLVRSRVEAELLGNISDSPNAPPES
jgi:ATP-dependent Clp protease ATP-binding subunit ClpA